MIKPIAALVIFAAMPASACDWVSSDRIDPMTDQKTCLIRSPTAKIAVAVRGNAVIFLSGSKDRLRDGLQLRIDDSPAIYIGDNRSTEDFDGNARKAMALIRSGKRLRTHYVDHVSGKDGDALICNLPELIDACK